MASKPRTIVLEGNETLSEVQNLIKELQLMEQNMKNGGHVHESGDRNASTESKSTSSSSNDPWRLLEDNELPDLDKLLAGELDGSLMAVPGLDPNLVEYPPDFTDIIDYITPVLVNSRYHLLNYVKSIINEEMIYNLVPTGSPCDRPNQSVDTSSAIYGTRGHRKDSFVIQRHPECLSDPLVTPAAIPTLCTSVPTGPTIITPQGIPITLPVIPDPSFHTPVTSKLHSTTNTYSKRSSPFSVPPRQHPTLPFNGNGNASDEEQGVGYAQDMNVNQINKFCSRTITRRIHATPPPTANMTFVVSPGDSGMEGHGGYSGSNGSLHNISMEELQSMARLQEEALSSGRPLARKDTHVVSQRSSFDDEEGSGSTGNRTWSNDTYSVDQSNPPSETSSGISSPPVAGSYEELNLASECLRRSMPNLTPKTLAMAPVASGQLQRDPRYNSDMKLSDSNTRTRVLRRPSAGISSVDVVPMSYEQHKYSTMTYKANEGGLDFCGEGVVDQGLQMENEVPLALVGANGQVEEIMLSQNGMESEGGDMNGYGTYKVRKNTQVRCQVQPPSSRMPPPRSYTTRNSVGGAHGEEAHGAGISTNPQRSMIPGPMSRGARFSLPPQSSIPRRST